MSFISLVILWTITQSKESWLDEMESADDSTLDQLLGHLVDLDTKDDAIKSWGNLYENANDFYFDQEQRNLDENQYDDDQDYTDYNDYDADYNEFYDDDDEYDEDYGDIYYDYSDEYRNMNRMNQYFDQLDEFYYNNYRLHTTYDNFENLDFSQILQNNMDSNDDYDDDMGINDLLSSLDQELWPDVEKLNPEIQKQSETSETKPSDTKKEQVLKPHQGNILDTASKNHMMITMILRSYMMYLRTAAHLQGRMKGNKGLKPLSLELQTLCKGDFGELDLSQIRVAQGVNTLHGDPVTFGSDIFFPRIIDPKHSESDLEMLLRQMKYAEMYTESDGIWPFLEKKMSVCKDDNNCDIFNKIVRQRSLDLMDVVRLDKAAENALKLELIKIWHQYGSLGDIGAQTGTKTGKV